MARGENGNMGPLNSPPVLFIKQLNGTWKLNINTAFLKSLKLHKTLVPPKKSKRGYGIVKKLFKVFRLNL